MGAAQLAFDFRSRQPDPLASPEAAPGEDRTQLPSALQPEQALAQELAGRLGRPVALTLTDNSRVMLSTSKGPGPTRVRLHRIFMAACPATLDAVARYLTHGSAWAGQVLNQFIGTHREHIKPTAQPRRVLLRTSGAHHDLQAIYADLNRSYFGDAIEARITWGRRTSSGGKRRRSIKLGSYSRSQRLIRVHPSLDRVWVPRYFVEHVVFHEMLHQAVPAGQSGGRQSHHGPEFRALEQTFADHERAMLWEREHLNRLLGS